MSNLIIDPLSISTAGYFTLSQGLLNDPLSISTRGYFAFVTIAALAVAIAPDFFLTQPLATLHLLISDIEHRNYRIASIGAGITIMEVD